MIRALSVAGITLAAALLAAAVPDPVSPDPRSPRPIEAIDSVFMEELTWMEIRDAMQAGKTTAIVATGGIEQNGPHVATGKHNYILKATTEAIARRLGNALVAPIVPFVPEGDIDPPTVHMKYPGTFSLTEETYQALLREICACLKTHGFSDIVLIGDSGGNQEGMKAVAAELNRKWAGGKTRVHFIPEYYNYVDVDRFLEAHGIRQTPPELHEEYGTTCQLMAVDPSIVRMKQRLATGRFQVNGVPLAPAEKTIEMGKKVIAFRTDVTVAKIRESIGKR